MVNKIASKLRSVLRLTRLQRQLQQATDEARRSRDLQGINSLLGKSAYVPWTSSALSPSAVAVVLNDVAINNRSNIVELGSGVSTIYTSLLLKSAKGKSQKKLYSVEHDGAWVREMRSILQTHGTEEFVEFVYAPLKKTKLSYQGAKWYDTNVLDEVFGDVVVDQLLVDGPPAFRDEIKYSRYPAMSFFENKLNGNCCIILDDIDRDSERHIAQLWEDQSGISFRNLMNRGNIAVGVRGQRFNI